MNSDTASPENTADSPLVDQIIPYLKAGDDHKIDIILSDLHPAEIATLLESLPKALRQKLWRLIPDGVEGDVLSELGEEARGSILVKMADADVVAAAETMAVEDLANVMDELPVHISEALLESLNYDHRKRLEASLAFAEGTAGRLMSTNVISVRKDVSITVVLRYLRRLKPLPHHTDALMVTDDNGIYLGKLPIVDAIAERPETLVADIMLEMADWVRATASDQDVSALFDRRELQSAAVVDEQGKLLGRITVNDVVDVILAKADKSLLALAGLNEEEDLFAPVLPSAKRRAIWLGINLVTVFLAAWVIGRFEEALDKIVALAVLLPIVASMGGIAGSQTLTLTIRGLALSQVTKSNLRWLGNKEMAVGLLNGVAWSIVVAIVTFAWFQDTGIALIIAAAMVLNLIAASLSGVLIPVILVRMAIDPALPGPVILTTVTDIIGFLSFLGLATLFLI